MGDQSLTSVRAPEKGGVEPLFLIEGVSSGDAPLVLSIGLRRTATRLE
jgi:hypothetical protein